MSTVLLLEDDQIAGLALRLELEDAGHAVTHLASTDEAKKAIESDDQPRPDFLLSDWSLQGDLSTLELVRIFKARYPSARVAFITGYPKEAIEDDLKGLEPYTIFTKPVDAQRIASALSNMP